jgi:uncharacterized protein YheU (UPF0270 family)
MEGLVKIALNAQKAREMAEQAGLVPAGNWKWALRNLRDGQGDLLQGRELAEAKEGIGKIPNNVRQKLESVSRRLGSHREVGMSLKESPRHQQKLNQYVNTNEIVPRRFHPAYRFGDTGSVRGQFGQDITHDIHTHPYQNAMNHINENVIESWISRKGGSNLRYNVSPQARVEELKRAGSKGHEIVTPSGYGLSRQKNPDLASDYVEGGDYQGMLMQRQEHQNRLSWTPQLIPGKGTHHVIVDPLHGNEGVHKLRPGFMRSVFFKNQGQY